MSKQFCPQGHDTWVIGRTARHRCKQCAREARDRWRQAQPHPGHKRRYCKNGHDTWAAGGRRGGNCKICAEALKQKRARENRAYVNQLKERGCAVCGYRKCLPALHWHHADSTTKTRPVAVMVERSRKRLDQELAKCILLCANCHTEVHHGQA